MFKRILSFFRPRESTAAVRSLFDEATAQRAVFRIEVGEGSGDRRYFVAAGAGPTGLELEPRGLRVEGMRHWKGQRFVFRFILCARDSGSTRLYEFAARVLSVDMRREIVTLALPDAVKPLERRQNVRIALQMRHMPRLGIWPVASGGAKNGPPRILSRPILDMPPTHSGMGLTLRNLSSGGMRLSLKKSDFAAGEVHLEPGRRLLVDLHFAGKAIEGRHAFRMIACVRNVVPGTSGRVEVGVQFLALHQPGGKPAWKNVEKGGVDGIGRLVHQFQVQYYQEIKKRLDRMPAKPARDISKAS